ncbi:MAG: response regulator [Opitutus sp.]|nr:response regulator [Opitutus sp.]
METLNRPLEIMTRTLLVVDDNKSVRDSLQLLLEQRGYAVLAAAGGAEALALFAAHAVDGAMIDVNMPGMGGLSLCRNLRTKASEAGSDFPVWMMTGAPTLDLERAARESGALTLLAKPFDYDGLFRWFEAQFGGAPEVSA